MNCINRQFLLAARPEGMVKPADFSYRESEIPVISNGEALIRVMFISMDPAMRGWMENRGDYMPALAIGEVMRAFAVGEVIETNSKQYRKGDYMCGLFGWQDYAVIKGDDRSCYAVDPAYPLPAYLGVLGVTGLTAYFGLLDIGQPLAGDTLLISAAAGAVGSTAGQIGKIKDCRVIGIAGSDQKTHWLKQQLGFDEVINYKTENVRSRIAALCPNGIDIYFDNVGGDILDLALARLNHQARVVLCGGISRYNLSGYSPGPANYLNLILRCARMQGFIVIDYAKRYPQALTVLKQWLDQGRLQYAEDIQQGFNKLPTALIRLFTGKNIGKQLAKIDADA